MKIISIYRESIGNVYRCRRIIFYLWFINIVYALAIVLPVHLLLKNQTGQSLMNDRLLQSFDLLWIADMIFKYKEVLPLLLGWILLPVLLYLLLNVFLSGGMIAALKDQRILVRLPHFFHQSAWFFRRFLGLFLLSIPAYIVLVGIPFGIAGRILDIFTSDAATEWPLIISANIKLLVFFVFFTIVNMLFDYAKIITVASDAKSVFKIFWRAFKFVIRHFFGSWALYLTLAILFFLGSVVYMEIEQLLPSAALGWVVLIFIWQQVYLLFRLAMKMEFYAAQMAWLDSKN